MPYWHVQRLLISELDLSASRGLGNGVGVGLTLPLRMVRDRIRFEDLSRQPYVPPDPDTHHRNETLTHLADPQLSILLRRAAGPWTLGSSAGFSMPVGRTEPNPFALGRLGLPHQHIQFGTGTWDPMLSAFAARGIGSFGVNASASARLAFSENSHGFRPGNRFGGVIGASRRMGAAWGVHGALSLDREEAEKWDGKVEEEGNLGRTDLFVRAGFGHTSGSGTFDVSLQLPVKTWARGEQVEFPWVVSTSWTR